MRVFIDTNLWAYRLDRRDPDKSEKVRSWLADVVADHEVVISTQVLIELRSVASRKLQPPLSDRQISELLAAMAGFEVVSTDANLASVFRAQRREQGAYVPVRRRRSCIGQRADAKRRPIGRTQPVASPENDRCPPPARPSG
ncbi:MAG: PIN domain-containing protein [Cyanobium sp.]